MNASISSHGPARARLERPRNLAQPDVRRWPCPQTRRSRASSGAASRICSLRTRSDRPPALHHPGFALKDPAVGVAEHRTPPALRAHLGDAGARGGMSCSREHIVGAGHVVLAGTYRWCGTCRVRGNISLVRDMSCSRGRIVGAGTCRVRGLISLVQGRCGAGCWRSRRCRPLARAWVPEGRRWP